MKLIEILILAGSQCISPLEGGPGLTDVSKVDCAVLVRHDHRSGAVEILPPEAATDPQVIAALMKPVAIAEEGRTAAAVQPKAAAEDGPPPDRPAVPKPRLRSAEAPATATAPPVVARKLQSRVAMTAPSQRDEKKTSARRLRDRCGSYAAVWYTRKDGHRRYRCVKPS